MTSIDKGNIDAPLKFIFCTIAPPTDGPMNAPAEYKDVNNPDIKA